MSSPADLARALAAKAHDDRYVLERLVGDAKAPAWVLGFHAQQAVEKALNWALSVVSRTLQWANDVVGSIGIPPRQPD